MAGFFCERLPSLIFMSMRRKVKTAGFAMFEILVTSSVIVFFVLAAMSVTVKSIQVSRQALRTSEASFLLEEGAEVMRILRDNGWSNIAGLTAGAYYYPTFSGSWVLSTVPSSVGIFTRTVRISSVNRDANSDIAVSGTADPGTKLVTVTVSWNEDGQVASKTLSFYIADIFS